MTEKSKDTIPSQPETYSWIRRSYCRIHHTVRKSTMKFFSIVRKFFSSSTLLTIIICVLVLLAASFVSVMFFKTVEGWMGPLLGLSEKNEILTYLGIGMGAMLVALQALMSFKRAKAMEDTANAQVEAAEQQAIANQNAQQALQQERERTEETAKAQARANLNTENGLRQERLKNAIEHLGNDSDSVRLGGAYELFHLAQDTKKNAPQRMYGSVGTDERFHLAQDTPDLSQTVLDILCAHIRRTTGEDEYRKTHQSKPSEEVQSLLTLLFVQKHDVFNGLPINLQNSWLNGAKLRGARLQKATLTRAHLKKADLWETCLHGATLSKACLHGADLRMSQLQGTDLYEAQLQGVRLVKAQLCGAVLWDALLHGANLIGAQLQGTDLGRTQFQGADVSMAQFQEAILNSAQLRGVSCRSDDTDTFAKRMRALIDCRSDLSSTIFGGGLNREDIDAIVKGLPDEKAKGLRKKLELHIGKPPSYGLPLNSRAITEPYNKEEAEKWIAGYERAMSEVSTTN